MQRGSSVNFQPVRSAGLAVAHANRDIAPEYLLPADKSLGTIVLIDDNGKVASTLEAKMALASRQAKRQGDYSPLWEGVINLRSPQAGEDTSAYKKECSAAVMKWRDDYEKMTGHTVLRADIHLDEGRLDDDGTVLFNAHAHVICDKTNELGRVLKVNAPMLRKIQDMTSEITELKRGESSLKTGHKHIPHQQYKYLAERGRLESQQLKEQLKEALNDNMTLMQSMEYVNKNNEEKITKLEEKVSSKDALIEKYKAERDALKASGTATQKMYQELKVAHEAALAKIKNQAKQLDDLEVKAISIINPLKSELKSTNEKVVKMDAYTKKLEAEVAASKAKVAQVLIEKAEAIEALVKSGEKSELMLKTATGHRQAAESLTATTPPPPYTGGETAMLSNEKAKSPVAPTFSPSLGNSLLKPQKTPREAFMELYGHFKTVLVGMIDGMRLDAADGRLGLFSQPDRKGSRIQVLCDVPENRVMPEIGQLYDSRARPGQSKSKVPGI